MFENFAKIQQAAATSLILQNFQISREPINP